MDTETSRTHRRMRWWLPAVVVVIAAATVAGISHAPELPIVRKLLYNALTVAVSLLMLLGWFLFLSAFRWRTRILTLLALVLAVLGFSRLVRLDGSTSGAGTPRLSWKWTPRRSGEIEPRAVATFRTATPGGDLKATVAYPGFLGAERNGIVPGISLERDWASHPPELLWRQPVGLGWSGFAVVGSSALTQEQRGPHELVICYDLATGRTLWTHTNDARFSEPIGGDGPRATPMIFSDRVYALGATGILDCLELADGKLVWTRNTLGQNRRPDLIWGLSSSPLITGGLVVVNGGMTNGPTLWAYRLADGAVAWKSGTDQASYSSPTLATLCGKRQILSVNAASVTAHDPADGHILWNYGWKSWGPRCAQPVAIAGDRVFLSAGFGVGCVMLQIKEDAAGALSVAELWKNLRLKTQFSTALVRDKYAYGLDEGVLACLDLNTGERKWKDGHYGFGQVVMVGDSLVVQSEAGPVVMVEASPAEFHELGRFNALSSKTWNTVAAAGEFFLTRNDQEAVCYRLPLRAGHPAN